ncbi:MAG: hypothetical protein Q8Q65_02190, partial [bacterium]|nr:hypothetical protein [bacterium]
MKLKGLAAIPLLITLAAIAGILTGTSLVQKSTQDSLPRADDGPGGWCNYANNNGCYEPDGCRAWEKCDSATWTCIDTTNGGTQDPTSDACQNHVVQPTNTPTPGGQAPNPTNTPIPGVATATPTTAQTPQQVLFCDKAEGCGGGCLNNHNYGCGYAGCRWWEACGGGRELGGCYATGDGSTQYDYLQAPDGACNARSTAGYSGNIPVYVTGTPSGGGGGGPTATPTPGSGGGSNTGECTPIDSVTLNKANPNAGESFQCKVELVQWTTENQYEISCGLIRGDTWDPITMWPDPACDYVSESGNTITFNCIMPSDMGAGSAFTMVGRDFISNTRCAGKTAAGTVGGGGTPNTPTPTGGSGATSTPSPTTGLTATNTPTPNTQVKRKSIKWTDSSGGICSTIWSANSCSEGISNWPGSNNPCTVSGNSISIPGNDRLLHCQYYECNACSASCDTYSRQIGSDIDSKNNCTYTCSESGITSTGAGCATQTPTPSPTSVPNATPTPTPTGTAGATATPSPTVTPTLTLTPTPTITSQPK